MQANFKFEEMSGLSKYWIEIIHLKNQEYRYEFRIDDSFFAHFKESEIRKGSLDCLIILRRTEGFIETIFHIHGSVELECDRSLDKFDFPVHITRTLIFKFGEEDREIDDKVEMISRNRQRIGMAQYIYEFIAMNIPMRRLHPKYGNEAEGKEEGLFYSSADRSESADKGEDVDPRWEALKKLRNN